MKFDDINTVREALRKINRKAGVLRQDPYALGLSLSQGSALVDINRHGPLKAQDLVRLLQLEKSSISRLLVGLEERGLVRFEDDPGDGRSKFVALTKQGRQAVESIDSQSDALVTGLLESLEKKRRDRVIAAFRDLIEVQEDL